MSLGLGPMAVALQEGAQARAAQQQRLQQLLAQRAFEERQQAEVERSHRASEAHAGAQLEQTGELRRAQETGTEEYRRGQQQTAVTLQQMRDAINQAKLDAIDQRARDVADATAQREKDRLETAEADRTGRAADRAERARHNLATEGQAAAALAAGKLHNLATEGQAAAALAAGKLTRVEDQDPDTGQTRVRYLPSSELAGQTFQKGPGQTVANRLASARVVAQTGEKMISKLSDPAYAATLGPVLGRYKTVQDFIGNPPPEFSELAGYIESYALANMGVHGMRSAQGAEQIKRLLDQKHTPASLAATITGLSAFSKQFVENEGGRTPLATRQSNAPRKRSVQEIQAILSGQ